MSANTSLSILVVEDSPTQAACLDRILMPHLDGFTILELLRTLIPEETFLPVIVLTADVTLEAKYRALSGGAIDFLSKPLDNTEVLLRVRNALRTRFIHRQLQSQNALLGERVRDRTRLLEESIRQLRQTSHSASTGSLPNDERALENAAPVMTR